MADRCPSCGGEALTAGYAHRWGCAVLMGSNLAAPVYVQTGWQCTRCNRVLAPHVNECPHCQRLAAAPPERGGTHA